MSLILLISETGTHVGHVNHRVPWWASDSAEIVSEVIPCMCLLHYTSLTFVGGVLADFEMLCVVLMSCGRSVRGPLKVVAW